MNKIEVICLGSSSAGNCFIFRKGHEVVLVECGLEYKTLLSKLMDHNVCVSDVVAVVVTHEHSDHNKSTRFFADRGVNCYVTRGCCSDEMLQMSNIHFLEEKKTFYASSWLRVLPFLVEHDPSIEAFGFAFLDTETKESILFINDTHLFYFDYFNVAFNKVFIECNHVDSQLETLLQCADKINKLGDIVKLKRQRATHMSLLACKTFLSKLNLKNTEGIYLMHLSRDCCNDKTIKNEIHETFGIPTFVCYRVGGIY